MTRRECRKTLRKKPGVDAISYGYSEALTLKTMEVQKVMKNKLFMALQLFADDPSPADTDTKDQNDRNLADPKPDAPDPDPKPDDQQKKYTDADVDKIINRKFAEWEKKQQAKVNEATKLAEMNAQEKAEYKASQLEAELNRLKEKETLADMSKTARKMLSEEDITIPDELLAHLVSTDAEDTKNTVQAFAKLFKDAVQEAIKTKYKGNPPKKGTGGRRSMTKDQIMAVKNPTERQKLIAEHMDLFQ